MSYQQYRPNRFSSLPVVIKNLLIINGLFFLAAAVLKSQKTIDLSDYLGLHYFTSDLFKPYQFVTYMFMHADLDSGGIFHIGFNMLALFMFGNVLENLWGPKRFLTFYMITGIGAALVYLGYQAFEYHQIQVAIQQFQQNATPDGYLAIVKDHFSELYDIPQNTPVFDNFVSEWMKHPDSPGFLTHASQDFDQLLKFKSNTPMVGASGAIFGILIAFGMLFPNTELMLMFIPIPIKAKYAVVLYAVAELFFGVARFSGDNIAHFAHLGGALFGFILVKYWQRKSNRFY